MNTSQFEQTAVWIYARKRNSGRDIHCEENAREISKEGQEVAYVFFVDIGKAFDIVPRKKRWSRP